MLELKNSNLDAICMLRVYVYASFVCMNILFILHRCTGILYLACGFFLSVFAENEGFFFQSIHETK